MEITEIVTNHIWTTEGQLHGDENLNNGVTKASQPGPSHEHVTQLMTHYVHVMKRLADGHITVISHHHKQKDLSDCKEVEREDLTWTAL
jgi:hypothetical protein